MMDSENWKFEPDPEMGESQNVVLGKSSAKINVSMDG